jgi:hypothetical protein
VAAAGRVMGAPVLRVEARAQTRGAASSDATAPAPPCNVRRAGPASTGACSNVFEQFEHVVLAIREKRRRRGHVRTA